MLDKCIFKFTKCDSGETLNPLMHAFLYITLVWGTAMAFFGHTETVSATVLYQQTASVAGGLVNTWGAVAVIAMVLHTAAFWIRKKIGPILMGIALFLGFFLWLWASIVYLEGGFVFQFLVACVPNLYFWGWYAVNRRRRVRGERVAFVH